jgi:alginate O-acetyltransferase complex protein AlgI
MTSAIDLAKGMIGLNGIALPQAFFDHPGHLARTLHGVGVIAESWSIEDFAKTAIWISVLMFVALACPNTLQILARYEPALGVKSQSTKFPIVEWDATLPWAIAVSVIAAMAIASIGGPSEFLYWQF